MINSKFRTWVQASVWAAIVIVLFLGLANTIVGMVSGNAWQSQAGIWQILASAFLTQALDNKKN